MSLYIYFFFFFAVEECSLYIFFTSYFLFYSFFPSFFLPLSSSSLSASVCISQLEGNPCLTSHTQDKCCVVLELVSVCLFLFFLSLSVEESEGKNLSVFVLKIYFCGCMSIFQSLSVVRRVYSIRVYKSIFHNL